jgi:hypothetical protein
MIWLFYCLVHLRYWPIHFSLGQMARRQTQTWQEVQQFNSVSVNCSTQEIKKRALVQVQHYVHPQSSLRNHKLLDGQFKELKPL